MGPLVRARRRLVWLGARRGGGQRGRRTCSSETLWAFAFLLWAQSGVLQRLMLSHGTKAQTRRPSGPGGRGSQQRGIKPPVPLPDGGRAGTGGRDFVLADSSKSARVK
jgi:hypothetical protein